MQRTESKSLPDDSVLSERWLQVRFHPYVQQVQLVVTKIDANHDSDRVYADRACFVSALMETAGRRPAEQARAQR